MNVQEGEYLLSVNGRELRATDNVQLRGVIGQAGQASRGPKPDGSGARDVTVVPAASDARLRNLAWIEGNRRKVDEATKARGLRLHARHGVRWAHELHALLLRAGRKEAAIIDERFNGGGALATDVIEQLNRRMMSLVATRDGEDEVQPQERSSVRR